MRCDRCNERAATVHMTEIVNKKKKEMHLCEECARKQGVSVKSAFGGGGASAASATNLPVVAKAKVILKSDELSGVSCPVCGTSFSDFRQSGRLGCPNDYLAFKRGLVPLLDKIHGQTEHRGKVPVQASMRLERQREIAELRKGLNAAIQREAYEEAAKLRDRIYELEEQ